MSKSLRDAVFLRRNHLIINNPRMQSLVHCKTRVPEIQSLKILIWVAVYCGSKMSPTSVVYSELECNENNFKFYSSIAINLIPNN